MRLRLQLVRQQCGSSYVEVLAALIVIALTAIPASNALRGAMYGARSDTLATISHFRLVGKMDEVLAEPFAILAPQVAGLTTPSAYSDAANSVDRRLVFISFYDGDNADADDDPQTGTDAGLLQVRVEIENTVLAIEALRTSL